MASNNPQNMPSIALPSVLPDPVLRAMDFLRSQIEAACPAFQAVPGLFRERSVTPIVVSEIDETGVYVLCRVEPNLKKVLSPAEIAVAYYTGESLPDKNIARELHRSIRTVEAHLRAIFTRIEISSRVELGRMAIQLTHKDLPGRLAP